VKTGGFLALGMYSKAMTDLKNNEKTSWNATLGQNLDRSFAGAVYESSFPQVFVGNETKFNGNELNAI